MNHLILVPIDKLPNIIPVIYPKIESAVAYSVGKYKGRDIVEKIVSGHMQLWSAYDEDNDKIQSIAITEIVKYPQRQICRFLCATGENAENWVDLIDGIEEWAVSIGCDGFQAECRPGWEKVLKPKGYVKSHVILNKDIGTCH